MHIVVDTQGTDREPEEHGCKRYSKHSRAIIHSNLHRNTIMTVNYNNMPLYFLIQLNNNYYIQRNKIENST